MGQEGEQHWTLRSWPKQRHNGDECGGGKWRYGGGGGVEVGIGREEGGVSKEKIQEILEQGNDLIGGRSIF